MPGSKWWRSTPDSRASATAAAAAPRARPPSPTEQHFPPMADTEILPPASTAVSPVSGIDQSVGDFRYDVNYDFDAGTGLTERTVQYIS
jgi:hypothetical protein